MITAKTKAKLIKRVSELKEDYVVNKPLYIDKFSGAVCFNGFIAEVITDSTNPNTIESYCLGNSIEKMIGYRKTANINKIHIEYCRNLILFSEAKKQVLAELEKVVTK